ncbi:MAG TPA: hypothetical protein VKT32_00880, partial [Chthonomonadaceae bacterium]|nr:hypothetical protein [Chthonomonadaceae bacterium]
PGENGLLIPTPVSSVLGDTFVLEFGDMRRFAAYLNTLSLHRVTDALAEAMAQMAAEPDRLSGMMRASAHRYADLFSEEAWRRTMRGVLEEAFPG